MNQVLVIIPAYNPNTKLIDYIMELKRLNVDNILVINDGSRPECQGIFDKAKDMGCHVERHVINQGKGRALKTAFNYYLNEYSKFDFIGVVTADSDGQHSAVDTANIIRNLVGSDNKLILGSRNFDGENVPIKSKFGNKVTTRVFQYLFGLRINDTQTGLRGILNSDIENYLGLDGEKFDYEINMLIHAARESDKSKILEVEIATIYEDNNSETHFKPVLDSLKIYTIMFRNFFAFISSSFLSCLIDLTLFKIFTTIFISTFSMFHLIFVSTLLSRILSGVFNYLVNKNIIFNSSYNKLQPLKYCLLAILQLCISSFFVYATSLVFSMDLTLIKIIIDGILFCLSYYIQKNYIFGTKK